jgi:hypothetical protein
VNEILIIFQLESHAFLSALVESASSSVLYNNYAISSKIEDENPLKQYTVRNNAASITWEDFYSTYHQSAPSSKVFNIIQSQNTPSASQIKDIFSRFTQNGKANSTLSPLL